MNIDEIRLVEKEMRKIIPIFMSELREYVPYKRYLYLRNPSNLCQVIQFASGIGMWNRNEYIYLAIQNSNTFRRFLKKEGYGSEPDAVLVNDDEWLDNDKDYLDYFDYAFRKGLKEVDYCLDILPHAIMHLIGSSDALLGEGITELRTREICKKHGIRCAPVLHSKEVKFALKMKKAFSDMELNQASFLDEFSIVLEKCDKMLGSDKFSKAYRRISTEYMIYTTDRVMDPLIHYQRYRELDFSELYELLDEEAFNSENLKNVSISPCAK